MKCPRCQGELKEIEYEGILVDTCEQCEGEWLDKDEISSINEAREAVFSEEEKAKVKGAQKVVTTEVKQLEKQLICPHCNVPLMRLNYAYTTGIIIDRCTKCKGIWLDKDELEHIQIVVEEWDKKYPEIKAKWTPLLSHVKAQYGEKRKARLDQAVKTYPGLLKKIPGYSSIIKSIVYHIMD